MSLGVRETGETAVRAGIRHILFTVQPPEVADSIDEYLKNLQPVPSPFLVKGGLSKAAQRGKKVFALAGCVSCHPPGYTQTLNLMMWALGVHMMRRRPIRHAIPG